MIKISLSKHAALKLKEREIEIEILKEVLRQPEFLFYDVISKTFIAIARCLFKNQEIYFIVPFTKEGDEFKIVTVYPCKDVKKEISKKEGKRWIRIP